MTDGEVRFPLKMWAYNFNARTHWKTAYGVKIKLHRGSNYLVIIIWNNNCEVSKLFSNSTVIASFNWPPGYRSAVSCSLAEDKENHLILSSDNQTFTYTPLGEREIQLSGLRCNSTTLFVHLLTIPDCRGSITKNAVNNLWLK